MVVVSIRDEKIGVREGRSEAKKCLSPLPDFFLWLRQPRGGSEWRRLLSSCCHGLCVWGVCVLCCGRGEVLDILINGHSERAKKKKKSVVACLSCCLASHASNHTCTTTHRAAQHKRPVSYLTLHRHNLLRWSTAIDQPLMFTAAHSTR
jgi:hypothetical protein